jgi:chemotaxis protein methyltransferase CheR
MMDKMVAVSNDPTDEDSADNYSIRHFIEITDREFNLFRSLIYQHFGINLTEAKRSLLMNRLQKILKQKGLTNFKQYYEEILHDTTRKELSELVDAVSTNHTFFFREKAHFDFLLNTALPEIIPALKRGGDRDLRVWCAASSTGEEPYVIAMLIKDYLGVDYDQWSAGVLATDISIEALNTAKKGIYTEERVRQVPARLKAAYFDKTGNDQFQIKRTIRDEVLFRRFNLMNETFPFKKPFQIIFCRNVMIYFDQKTRERLVNRLFTFTAPGGYLFIGNAETLGRENCPYRYIEPSVYQRVP